MVKPKIKIKAKPQPVPAIRTPDRRKLTTATGKEPDEEEPASPLIAGHAARHRNSVALPAEKKKPERLKYKTADQAAPEVERVSYLIPEFCAAHRLSVSMYYKMKEQKKGPKETKYGNKITITKENAALWLKEREEDQDKEDQAKQEQEDRENNKHPLKEKRGEISASIPSTGPL